MSDWFDKEMEALERQLDEGQITQREFQRECALLRRDYQEEQYRQDMMDAGRGHQLGSW